MSRRRRMRISALPIEQRKPGGLGLHLIRRLVDSVALRLLRANAGESRTTFRMTPAARRSGRHREDGGKQDAGDRISARTARWSWRGGWTRRSAPTAQAFLDQVEGTVTLDCSRLEYISSAGLGVLLKTQKRLMASAGKLRLAGVQPHLRDIFVYSGFDQIFEIEPAPFRLCPNFSDRGV